MGLPLRSLGASFLLCSSLLANSPPATPVISEPAVDGQIVNAGNLGQDLVLPESQLDVTDHAGAIFILNFLFQGCGAPRCFDAADVNDSGDLDISDAIRALGYLFSSLPPPPQPFPGPGTDPTPDSLPGCAP